MSGCAPQPALFPRGVSVYVRRVDALTDRECAARAATFRASGIRNAFVMVEPVDAAIAKESAVRRMVDACAEQGIAPYLWSFPDHTRRTPAQVVATLSKYAAGSPVVAPIYDSEKAGGSHPPAEYVTETVKRMADLCGELGAGGRVGVTSYGVPSWHRMPWRPLASALIACGGWYSPQTYKSALRADDAARAMRETRALFGACPVVPSIPAYDVDTTDKVGEVEQMRVATERMGAGVDGLAVWSDPQLSASERGVLKAYAEKRGWR